MTDTESDDHDCVANLASTRNDIVEGDGEVLSYRDCTVCGTEMVTVYEYSETYPV